MIIALIISVLLFISPSSAQTLEDVIANLRDNESLYHDIEVKWVEQYQIGTLKRPIELMVKSRERSGTSIAQDGMFRSDCIGQQAALKGDERRIHKITSYDGETTRVLEDRGSYIANIVDGARYDLNAFDPFTIPLRRFGIQVPLSVWLQGPEAIKADSRGRLKSNLHHRSNLAGHEVIDGIRCHKIVVEYFRPTNPTQATDKRIFWLAIERNYMPIRAEAYNLLSSDTLTNESTSWTDFEEVAPGVSYPHRIVHTGFDEPSIREDHRLVASSRAEFIVESVTLNPSHPVAYFRHLEIPDGTPVYYINRNREIYKSEIKGGVRFTDDGGNRWSPWILLVNAAVVVAIGMVLINRRRRRV
jgi:hypothetical protein